MFRVTFMCDDNKLGKALRALTGLAAENPQVQPMANAVAENGKVKPTIEGTTLPEMVKNKLLNDGIETIAIPELKVMIQKLGYNPVSVGNVIQQLFREQKFLRRVGKGTYEVRH